jgi:hypothetical protein
MEKGLEEVVKLRNMSYWRGWFNQEQRCIALILDVEIGGRTKNEVGYRDRSQDKRSNRR